MSDETRKGPENRLRMIAAIAQRRAPAPTPKPPRATSGRSAQAIRNKRSTEKLRYHDARKTGTCVECKQRPSGGRARCDQCASDKNARQNRQRAEARAAGRCTQCRQPAALGYKLCPRHLEISRNRTASSRAQGAQS
jgi:hypothetical protein